MSQRKLRYGEHEFETEWPPFLRPHEAQDIEGGKLLTFVDACGRFVLRAEDKDSIYAMKGPRDAMPRMARHFDPDAAARNAGILGVMKGDSGHFLASPYGAAFAVGDRDSDVWEGLTGSEVGEAYGLGGLGLINEGCTPSVVWTAPAETPLRWPSGGEAGRVLVTHVLPKGAIEQAGGVCFPASDLEVCIETTKLQRENVECPIQADGFGTRAKPRKLVDVQLNAKAATVSAGLDPDIVRRIIRAHVNELRFCYNAGLSSEPSLAGEIEIAFSIGPTGKVASSKLHASKLVPADESVPKCFVAAVKRWTFPKPRDGVTVDVVYPFALSSK